MSMRNTKGTNLATVAKFIDEKYSHSDRERIHAQFSDELRSTLKVVDPSEWYSVDLERELHAAMAAIAESEEEAEARSRELGRYLFEAALGTFMRLVMRVLTPAMFFKKTKDIWPRMFSFGAFEVDANELEKNRAVMLMSGVEGCDYMPTVSAGFIEQAVQTIGYKEVEVDIESLAEPGAYRFEVRWA